MANAGKNVSAIGNKLVAKQLENYFIGKIACGIWESDQWVSTSAGFCQFADGLGHGTIEVAYQLFTGLACTGPTEQDADDCIAFASVAALSLDIYVDMVTWNLCDYAFQDIQPKCGKAGGAASVKILDGVGAVHTFYIDDMMYMDSTATCPATSAATTCAVTHL